MNAQLHLEDTRKAGRTSALPSAVRSYVFENKQNSDTNQPLISW